MTNRLRIELDGEKLDTAKRVVKSHERLSNHDQRKVTPDDIHAAVRALAQGGDGSCPTAWCSLLELPPISASV